MGRSLPVVASLVAAAVFAAAFGPWAAPPAPAAADAPSAMPAPSTERAAPLLALMARGAADPLDHAVALARAATDQQAADLGLGALAGPDPARHASPSAALAALLALDGRAPAPLDLAAGVALDALPAAARDGLARVLDAFLAYADASRAAFAHADAGRLAAPLALLRDPDLASADPERAADLVRATDWAAAGIDLAPLLSARNTLLAAVADLPTFPVVPANGACAPLSSPPTYSIDLAVCDNTYVQDVELLIDVGGNDLYLNNAGGSNLRGADCVADVNNPTAAALVDLAGNDRYGDPLAPRDCGRNGGGLAGAGLLVDATGADRYTVGGLATNGGGFLGAGLLVDATGGDAYPGGNAGSNGGGFVGAGGLVDGEGADNYTAFSLGTNGGGETGAGFLVDGAGADRYTAFSSATNGGSGGLKGKGLLVDGAGNDAYVAGGSGTNGGGYFGGFGLLADGAGDDAYTGGAIGTNGGSFPFGPICTGTPINFCVPALSGGGLLDGNGRDTYLDQNNPNGSGTDRDLVPKGQWGFQLDA